MAKVDLKLQKGCCKQGAALAGVISPFNRVVALEQAGDGPVAGLAACHQCGAEWRFALVAERGEVRVYGLHRLPAGGLARLMAAYARYGKPKWPVWVPPDPIRIRQEDHKPIADAEDLALGQLSRWEYVLATKALVNGRVLGAAKYDGPADWPARLGV